ncbi:DUF2147 domain-containing protein [Undibacterium squillarum]|uniref:DUF2147 domain-containing protein n=1 Tax=Undibacterium squillarum TaxID=1131567 RepID=A0ABQ2XZ63_9BURK|nr:DUF2147 domain-containing protein [Undibacterium squillarum]GGX45361.1 hypothetical protein GCM10010946_24700 [Undibacterium squillarum]
MKRFTLLAILSTVLIAPFAHADDTPVGLWKNIDDKTGKPKALIRITETGGEYKGKIEKLFLEPGADQNPKCTECDGANKDQPIIGMTILFGLKKDGDEYNGGKIIDPANGKTYSSKLTVVDNNKKLNVRGYIGTPFLGRSQTWVREQ